MTNQFSLRCKVFASFILSRSVRWLIAKFTHQSVFLLLTHHTSLARTICIHDNDLTSTIRCGFHLIPDTTGRHTVTERWQGTNDLNKKLQNGFDASLALVKSDFAKGWYFLTTTRNKSMDDGHMTFCVLSLVCTWEQKTTTTHSTHTRT